MFVLTYHQFDDHAVNRKSNIIIQYRVYKEAQIIPPLSMQRSLVKMLNKYFELFLIITPWIICAISTVFVTFYGQSSVICLVLYDHTIEWEICAGFLIDFQNQITSSSYHHNDIIIIIIIIFIVMTSSSSSSSSSSSQLPAPSHTVKLRLSGL